MSPIDVTGVMHDGGWGGGQGTRREGKGRTTMRHLKGTDGYVLKMYSAREGGSAHSTVNGTCGSEGSWLARHRSPATGEPTCSVRCQRGSMLGVRRNAQVWIASPPGCRLHSRV